MPPATVAFEDRVRAWEGRVLSEDATPLLSGRARRRRARQRRCARRSSATATGSSHSKSFRRLKHKTQVFIAPEGDHYRTRLSHTLEACGIARTVAARAGL